MLIHLHKQAVCANGSSKSAEGDDDTKAAGGDPGQRRACVGFGGTGRERASFWSDGDVLRHDAETCRAAFVPRGSGSVTRMAVALLKRFAFDKNQTAASGLCFCAHFIGSVAQIP